MCIASSAFHTSGTETVHLRKLRPTMWRHSIILDVTLILKMSEVTVAHPMQPLKSFLWPSAIIIKKSMSEQSAEPDRHNTDRRLEDPLPTVSSTD